MSVELERPGHPRERGKASPPPGVRGDVFGTAFPVWNSEAPARGIAPLSVPRSLPSDHPCATGLPSARSRSPVARSTRAGQVRCERVATTLSLGRTRARGRGFSVFLDAIGSPHAGTSRGAPQAREAMFRFTRTLETTEVLKTRVKNGSPRTKESRCNPRGVRGCEAHPIRWSRTRTDLRRDRGRYL